MVQRKLAALLLCGALAFLWSASASAGQKIRMYKMNSKLQQTKITLGGAVEKAGCHDLFWGKRCTPVAKPSKQTALPILYMPTSSFLAILQPQLSMMLTEHAMGVVSPRGGS